MLTRHLRHLAASLLLLAPVVSPASPALAQAKRDTLTIGMTQFPATLNPLIDSMLARSYVLAMVLGLTVLLMALVRALAG